MSKIDNFPYPIPIPAKIWGCFLWSRSVMLGSAESEKPWNYFPRIQIYMTTIPQRHIRTDRQTDNLPFYAYLTSERSHLEHNFQYKLFLSDGGAHQTSRARENSPFSPSPLYGPGWTVGESGKFQGTYINIGRIAIAEICCYFVSVTRWRLNWHFEVYIRHLQARI